MKEDPLVSINRLHPQYFSLSRMRADERGGEGSWSACVQLESGSEKLYGNGETEGLALDNLIQAISDHTLDPWKKATEQARENWVLMGGAAPQIWCNWLSLLTGEEGEPDSLIGTILHHPTQLARIDAWFMLRRFILVSLSQISQLAKEEKP